MGGFFAFAVAIVNLYGIGIVFLIDIRPSWNNSAKRCHKCCCIIYYIIGAVFIASPIILTFVVMIVADEYFGILQSSPIGNNILAI